MSARSLVLTFSSVALVGLCQMATPVVTTVEAQGRAIRFQEWIEQRWRDLSRGMAGLGSLVRIHDWNGDGRLSGEEVRVGARRNIEWEGVDHAPEPLRALPELDAQPTSPTSITTATAG